ncbi:MAG: hypothetical protein H6831_05250 [Planctomycetes bacterium]|nr:hypothetical protein [Planctomycetota bacterium]
MKRSLLTSSVLCCSLLVNTAIAIASDTLTPETLSDGTTTSWTGVSPLPNVLFDFEDKDDHGVYPYGFELSGAGRIGDPGIPGMAFSGVNVLILGGGALTVLEFAVPVEYVEFVWLDQNETVKADVKAFDTSGALITRGESWTEAWASFYYADSTRPISRLEFLTQTPGSIGVVDDLRVRHRETAQSFCFGDGSTAGCPCANHSASGSFEGCTNSSGRGARMHSIGRACTTAAELHFYVTGLPAQRPALLLEGTQDGAAYPFRDGILCLGHLRRRLGVAFSDAAGAAQFGQSVFDGKLEPQAGEVLDYQCWFRDPLVSVCGTGSGFSQAQRVWWD